MKTLMFACSLCIAFFAAPAAIAHPHPAGIDVRQNIQDARIHAGWRRGELTGCEAARLHQRADRIAYREAGFRASGGLQPYERAHLQRSLNGLSRDIREQRRDGRGCW